MAAPPMQKAASQVPPAGRRHSMGRRGPGFEPGSSRIIGTDGLPAPEIDRTKPDAPGALFSGLRDELVTKVCRKFYGAPRQARRRSSRPQPYDHGSIGL